MNVPLNIDWQQILLHLFNFIILAGGLYLLLYKPVKNFMEKREANWQSRPYEGGYVVSPGWIDSSWMATTMAFLPSRGTLR